MYPLMQKPLHMTCHSARSLQILHLREQLLLGGVRLLQHICTQLALTLTGSCRHNWGRWVMTLNELTPGLEKKVAPTDCRLRPDQHYMEIGEFDKVRLFGCHERRESQIACCVTTLMYLRAQVDQA